MRPPYAVASSYGPSSDDLLGRGWYPAFKNVLRVVISCQPALIVAAFAFVGAGPLERGSALLDVLGLCLELRF